MKRLTATIIMYIFMVVAIQTFIRWFYQLMPWYAIPNPSSDYLKTVNFFDPNNLTILVTVIFIFAALYARYLDQNEKTQ